jgi:predicted DCC family thiol-disulfide oxidoreductase YuxK
MKIILFDGVCNLCNGAVQFIIARDKQQSFHFASLQSEYGKILLEKYNLDPLSLKSVVFVNENEVFTQSSAVLKIANQLGGIWKITQVAYVIPMFIRDAVYGFIAKNRYRWFGAQDVCWIPTLELKNRFLS